MRAIRVHVLISSLILTVSPVIAQTTAPAANTSGGMGWIWIVLLLAVVGAAVWYFMFRKKSGGTSSMGVDRDRIAGSAEQAKGSIKEGVGSVLGDAKLQAEGKLDKAEGKAQNTVGGIKDTLKGR
jgi:uncharacterized protein YjbJ (UPF0337 family)